MTLGKPNCSDGPFKSELHIQINFQRCLAISSFALKKYFGRVAVRCSQHVLNDALTQKACNVRYTVVVPE